MSLTTFTTVNESGDTVSVEVYPGGVVLDVESELGQVAVGLDQDKARQVGEALIGTPPADYDDVLGVLFDRIANAADAAEEPALKEFLVMLGVGFAVDNTPATREAVRALVGA